MQGRMTMAEAATATADRELVVTRVFEAPREVVFRAWTDPKQAALWWGPAIGGLTSFFGSIFPAWSARDSF